MARRHLAVFVEGAAEKILSSNKKVEIRLSKNQIVPYLEISKGDEILLKISGRDIIGKVIVENVLFYDNLTPATIRALEEIHFKDAKMSETFWKSRQQAKFATVIFLKNPQKFISPVKFKKNDRRAWIIIEE